MENNLKKWVIDVIINKLADYEGVKCYGSDIAYQILEEYNIDGSYTYSAYEAVEWVKTYFEDLGEAVEHYEDVFGEKDSLPNVFDKPEAFQVCILLLLADYYIQNNPGIIDVADEEIVIDKKLIKNLSEWLEYQANFYGLLYIRPFIDKKDEAKC